MCYVPKLIANQNLILFFILKYFGFPYIKIKINILVFAYLLFVFYSNTVQFETAEYIPV